MYTNLLGFLALMSFLHAPVDHVMTPVYLFGQDSPISMNWPLTNNLELAKNPKRPPIKKDKNNFGIKTLAQSVFVADVDSGGILFAKNIHDKHSIASLTKIMTALVVLEHDPELKGNLVLVKDDFSPMVRNVFFVGDVISKKDALAAMLVGSVNELGAAFSRSSGMSQDDFIKEMNKKAKDLNLSSLSFFDATGLNPDNKGNAADVAALLTIALRDSRLKNILNKQKVVLRTELGKEYLVKSTNHLLTTFLNKDPYKIIGAKTGTLPEAGFCLAQVTQKDNHQVVVVVLHDTDHFLRYKDVKALTYWAFDSYNWFND